MLTVWSVCWGSKYHHDEVRLLQRMVERNLTIPHQFKCLTDQDIIGIQCVPQISDKPGWWQKWDLFSFVGQNLYFDLDVVLTGNVDCFVGTDKDIKTCLNWAVSGHMGVQSSIMYWADARKIYAAYDPITCGCWPPFSKPNTLHGDQCRLTELRDSGQIEADYFDSKHTRSFKYHLRQGLTDDCRVAIFHGDPKPDKVNDAWVKEARS